MTKVERAEAALLRLLEGGRLGLGGRLPPERDLCSELGVSRSTLRRVLELLEAKGKIWRHVGRGTFVGSRPVDPSHSLVAISEATSPSELMEFRLILEPQIARLAAMHASQTEIAYMRQCVKRSEEAKDSRTYELWDGTLHQAIVKATHNSLVVAVFEAVNKIRNLTSWGRLRDLIISPREKQLYWCRQHKAFVDAIADRNAGKAEELARVHVEDVLKSMSEATKTKSR